MNPLITLIFGELNYCWVGLQWFRSPGKKGSHFNPYSDLFLPDERKYVVTSTICWTLMVGLIYYLSKLIGSVEMLKIYGVPYLVSVP